jgi:HEAT repeat protein
MEVVDKAATDYLHALLSDANNEKIVTALKIYKGSENERKSDFYKIRDQHINEKQTQYDALITNMSSGALPPEVLGDIGRKLQQLKDEIESLRTTEPPEDYTADQVKSWLSALRQASDDKAIHLLVERIDIKNKTDISVTSKLTSVLGIIGCGRPLHILPEILFLFKAYKR